MQFISKPKKKEPINQNFYSKITYNYIKKQISKQLYQETLWKTQGKLAPINNTQVKFFHKNFRNSLLSVLELSTYRKHFDLKEEK